MYERVAQALQRDIEKGRVGPGARIASIRELCERFGVGDVTAKRAVRRLRERGWVRTVAGSGAFVAGGGSAPLAKAKRNTAGLLMLGGGMRPIFQYEVELLQQELQRRGIPLVYSVAPGFDALPQAIEHQRDAGVGCLIFFPRHGSTRDLDQGVSILRKAGLPMLILETPHATESSVAADIPTACGLLVDHLYGLSHRRICLISGFHRKIEGFEARVKRIGDASLEPRVIPVSAEGQAQMLKLVDEALALRPRPTAMIACNDRLAEALIVRAIASGLRVPEDLSVATFDDHPELSQHSPVPVTAVRHPAAEIAQEVARWAQQRLSANQNAGRKLRRLASGSLVMRDSTAPPSPAEEPRPRP